MKIQAKFQAVVPTGRSLQSAATNLSTAANGATMIAVPRKLASTQFERVLTNREFPVQSKAIKPVETLQNLAEKKVEEIQSNVEGIVEAIQNPRDTWEMVKSDFRYAVDISKPVVLNGLKTVGGWATSALDGVKSVGEKIGSAAKSVAARLSDTWHSIF